MIFLIQKLGSHPPTPLHNPQRSGFFGGLSGHQGAFRSVFLLPAGLSKLEPIGKG